MRVSIMKKVLASALTIALVAAPSMGVFAAGCSSDSSATPCGGSSTTEVVSETVHSVAPTVPVAASEPKVEAIPTTSSVAGVVTTTAGVYLAKGVNGTAITSSVDAIAAGYGLTAGEKPFAKFSDLKAKESPLAAAALTAVAASQGAEVGPMFNLEIGKMSAGKYSLLPSDGAGITVKVGIPANFQADGKTYAVAVVRPGGAVSVLSDVDSDAKTVTFVTTGGQGAYAIIRY